MVRERESKGDSGVNSWVSTRYQHNSMNAYITVVIHYRPVDQTGALHDELLLLLKAALMNVGSMEEADHVARCLVRAR